MSTLLFATAIFSLFNDAVPFLTSTPQNTIIVSGQTTRLNCSSNITASKGFNPISWRVNTIPTPFIGAGCTTTDSTRFEGILSGDSCDLRIVPNVAATPGTYGCNDNSPITVDKEHAAIVLVLAREPACELDRPPVQNQPLNIVCSLGKVSYGSDPLLNPPLLQWTSCESFGETNATIIDPGDVQLQNASFKMTPHGKWIPRIQCDVHFEFDGNGTSQQYTILAANDVNYTVFTNETRVQFCPENMNVTLPPYYGGSVLYCYADAYYLPTYNWTNNLNTSYPSTVGQTLILPTDGGEFDFNCWAFATGNLTGVCNATKRVHGFAIKCPYNVLITPTPSATVIEVGDSYNCTANSNPPANFTWYNTSNGAAYTTNQQTVTITSSGPFTLTCNATVTQDNATCTNYSSPFIGYARKCPKIVIISPQRSVAYVGDTLTCTSDSDPAANTSYVWHSVNATAFSVNADNSITVKAPGLFSLSCTANLTVYGVSCVRSNETNGTAIECPGSVSITPQNKTVFVGATFNCSTSSYPQANYTWVDASNVVRSYNQTVTVEKAGDFSFTCNASIPVGGSTCFNTSTITGRAISCPPNVTISPQNTQPLAGTAYNCSSDGPANDTTYSLSLSDGTTASTVSSPYIANNPGSFQLTCTASVSVGGVSCSNDAVLNITVIATTTVAPTTTTIPTTTTPVTTTAGGVTTTITPPTANTASSTANSGSTAPVNTGTATTNVVQTGSGASTVNTLSTASAGSAASAAVTPNTGSTVNTITGITVAPGGGSSSSVVVDPSASTAIAGSGNNVTTSISGVSASPSSNTGGSGVNPTIDPNSLNNTTTNQTGSAGGQTSTADKVDQAKILSAVIIPFVGVVAIIGAMLLVRFCLTRGAAAWKQTYAQTELPLRPSSSFFQRPERPYDNGRPSVYDPERRRGLRYMNGYPRS